MCSYYKWSLFDLERLYLKDISRHLRRVKQSNENEVIEKLVNAQLLISIIHSEPNELSKKLEHLIEGNIYDNEIGDLEGIEKLKIKQRRS